MELVEKLTKDMVEAMKAKDKDRLTVIRMVKGALDKERIDKKVEVSDDLLIDVVNKQVKMRNDSITEFEKAGRNDLVEETKNELEILKEYLPEQISQEEATKIIEETITALEATSMKDMGRVIKELNPKLKGRIDMKFVSDTVKDKLN